MSPCVSFPSDFLRFVGLLLATLGALAPAKSEDLYLEKIKPLLESKCVSCHGPVRHEAGLRLDAAVLIRRGSDEGSIIDANQPLHSRLLQRVASEDKETRMPPLDEGVPFTAQEKLWLAEWIEVGLPAPDHETYLSDPKEHWSFRPISSQSAPVSIDARLSAHHERRGLRPQRDADPYVLIRRAYFDLIGLPPTLDEISEFVAAYEKEQGNVAYARMIDSLLARPEHGERWGRHWMDIWRYSDWDGYREELRGSQRHIWHWRDWIVQSLNEAKPYDQMILEMLAADEVYPTDLQALRATGFLARNFHVSNRNIWLDATVEHTAKAFLGLTVNCAKCHDHKYDPIAQSDYYRFRAIFEPYEVRTDPVPGVLDEKLGGVPRVYDAKLSAETFLFIRGNEKAPRKDLRIDAGPPGFLNIQWTPTAIELPLQSYYPAIQTFAVQDALNAAEKENQAARKKWLGSLEDSKVSPFDLRIVELKATIAETRLQALRQRILADQARYLYEDRLSQEEKAMLVTTAAYEQKRQARYEAELREVEAEKALETAKSVKPSEKPEEAKKQATAVTEAEKKLAAVRKSLVDAIKAMESREEKYTGLGKEYPKQSTGRRTALARWITDKSNPLTARVAVNHVWSRHFGEPLVENVFDFGLKTPAPELLDVLDHLAAELIASDWDLKQIHRAIMNSQAYRRASLCGSEAESANALIDPENRSFWRSNVQRLEAEVIRDAFLAVADSIHRRMGGADIEHQQGDRVHRRSIYFRHAYEKQMPFLVTLDAASPLECYRRSPSIVPQQALALANGELARSMARQFAKNASSFTSTQVSVNQEFLDTLFLKSLSRRPTQSERAACIEFLAVQTKRFQQDSISKLTLIEGGVAAAVEASTNPEQRARESLAHVLFNHNDFVTVR